MKFESQFSLGDRIFHIRRDTEQLYKECHKCRGKGELTILFPGGSQEKTDCRECHDGRVRAGSQYSWRPQPNPLTVGKITVEVDGNDLTIQETYMCNETGIGSGTLYRGQHMFSKHEDAERHCNHLNSNASSYDYDHNCRGCEGTGYVKKEKK